MVHYLLASSEVENASELLAQVFKNYYRIEKLTEAVVQHNMTDLVKFLLALDEKDVVRIGVTQILESAAKYANKDIITTVLNAESCWPFLRPRNVFHHAAAFTEITKLLLEGMEKVFAEPRKVYDLIHQGDENGCTAIHFAAVAGNIESLKILAQWSVRCNKDSDKTECDYILSCVECKSWKSCLHRISVDTLKNAIESLKLDHQTSIPFNRRVCLTAASREGKTDLIRYLLDIKVPIHTAGYLIRENPLQAAVYSGSLSTVKLITQRCRQFLKARCMVNKSPAEIAAKENKKDILEYLISSYLVDPVDENTGINLLDNAALYKGKICMAVMDAIIKRYPAKRGNLTDALEASDTNFISFCVRWRPKVALYILDIYGSRGYYDFYPLKGQNKGDYVEVIKEMVKSGHEEFLSHRLVDAFLDTQLNSPAAKTWYFLNLFMYVSFLALFSAYIGLYAQGTVNLKSAKMVILTVFILLFCSINMVKEILQMINHIKKYVTSIDNVLEWTLYICTFIFLLPMKENKSKSQIEAGAIAIFLSWINFIWFLKRFQAFGIYVVLTKKVFFSLLKVLPVVIFFVIAFTMTFLLLKHEDYAFSTMPWSALTIFIMMGGEIDYRDAFLSSESSVYIVQCLFLVMFFLIMSIVVMNVFVGLAVGDTGEMMKRSRAENQLLKANLWIELEKSLSKLPEKWRPKPIVGKKAPKTHKPFEEFDKSNEES